MLVHVLACDYDGTIAAEGRVDDATKAALARVRESGRKLILVTGRLLPDLRTVFPDTDRLFDVIVAENGALLYLPAARETRTLGEAPEATLVEALRRRSVLFDLGSSIVATTARYAEAALAAIRETGVERTLVFNRGSLMLLPGGVTKGTGLEAALETLELSVHNVVGVGDAENDHAFLALCECAVAVGDAIEALRARADHVTRGPGPQGVVELIEQHVLGDLRELGPALARHGLALGTRADATPVALDAHRTSLLIVGPSGTGKSTVTGVLVERLVDAGRSVCVLDPEGDYQTLGELEGVVVLGGKAERTLPSGDELAQLLRRPTSRVVLNLSAMSRSEKVAYGTQILAAVAATRGLTGMPHWLVIDEAHHLFPADASVSPDVLRREGASLCLSTLSADLLAPGVRGLPTTVVATDLAALVDSVKAVLDARGSAVPVPVVSGGPLAPGEVALAALAPRGVDIARFRAARRRQEHRRHVRKYTEGELPPHRSFFFRGPDARLNLRAVNLVRFCELAEGIDDATWAHHLRRGDYSRWIRETIKDPALADELAALERDGARSADGTRRAALEAIRRRYAV
jgi:hydroxymethylpyrimidine pyrophosphatase-like HAD family hydrolase